MKSVGLLRWYRVSLPQLQTATFVISILSGLMISRCAADEFTDTVLPFLEQHCIRCHGGEKTKGDIDLSTIKSIEAAKTHFEMWETAVFMIEDAEMPPEDEPQPSKEEQQAFLDWYDNTFLADLESKPAVFKQRRLSGPEYRNTMRSLFGFDLEVNIMEAEQTVVEKSLVLKLLPTDPPGASGFVNDTHTAALSTTIWDQYSYLADFALEQLFSTKRNKELAAMLGEPIAEDSSLISNNQAEQVMRNFIPRAFRRPIPEEELATYIKGIEGKEGEQLIRAVQSELKTVLMSPAFLYRGFLMPTEGPTQQPVDTFELAERLSYFLWEDMPDTELFNAAKSGKLNNPEDLAAQIDRMLASPKSRTLAESFGSQWLLLDQISHDRNDPPYLHALTSQPLDFLHYLFTEDRPVMELIDSKVTFTNSLLASYYGNDRKQLERFIKPKGIERMGDAQPAH